MRPLLVIAVCSTILSGNLALAGGFAFDSNRCPQGNWLPTPVPPAMTSVLCSFFSAIDRGDYGSAYNFLSPEFRLQMPFREFEGEFQRIQQRRTSETGHAPERFVVDVGEIRGQPDPVMHFSFRTFYPNLSSGQDLYLRQHTGTAEIVGLRLAPY